MEDNTKKIIIPISEAESDYIEKLQYEYMVRINTLHYLLKQGDIDDAIINKYTNRVENAYAELEVAKKELSMTYIPNNDQIFNYNIDFKKKQIQYSAVGGN